MAQLSLRNLHLRLGNTDLLTDANLQIHEGEHICLIGRNGVGKSSLLKLLSGSLEADAGHYELKTNTVIAYLPQDVPQDFNGSIYKIVTEGLGEVGQLLLEYETINHQLTNTTDDALLTRQAQLIEQIDLHNAWDLEQSVAKILSIMNLEPDVKVETLSGGLRRRVLLAKALVINPDILLQMNLLTI